MALKSERDKRICEHYRNRDAAGRVQCCKCPLRVGPELECTCKAIMHYDRHKKEWVYDDSANYIYTEDAEEGEG